MGALKADLRFTARVYLENKVYFALAGSGHRTLAVGFEEAPLTFRNGGIPKLDGWRNDGFGRGRELRSRDLRLNPPAVASAQVIQNGASGCGPGGGSTNGRSLEKSDHLLHFEVVFSGSASFRNLFHMDVFKDLSRRRIIRLHTHLTFKS